MPILFYKSQMQVLPTPTVQSKEPTACIEASVVWHKIRRTTATSQGFYSGNVDFGIDFGISISIGIGIGIGIGVGFGIDFAIDGAVEIVAQALNRLELFIPVCATTCFRE